MSFPNIFSNNANCVIIFSYSTNGHVDVYAHLIMGIPSPEISLESGITSVTYITSNFEALQSSFSAIRLESSCYSIPLPTHSDCVTFRKKLH